MLVILLLAVLLAILIWRLLVRKRRTCPYCGHAVRDRQDQFCGKCGQAFQQGFSVITKAEDDSHRP